MAIGSWVRPTPDTSTRNWDQAGKAANALRLPVTPARKLRRPAGREVNEEGSGFFGCMLLIQAVKSEVFAKGGLGLHGANGKAHAPIKKAEPKEITFDERNQA